MSAQRKREMWNVCPKCNHLNNDDSTRCEQCGHRLGAPGRANVPALTLPPAPSYQPFSQPRPRRNYLDEWFGPTVTFERKRRNTTIIVGGGIMLLLALGYASAGFYCNTLIWLVFAAFLAWAVSSVAKEKGSETRTAAVILFVVLPLLFAALIPWPNQLGAENREPIFVDHLSYYTVYIVEDGSSQIVVSGYIANDGKGGGQATVRISAYGGPPANNTDPADIENAFKEAYVDTGWIEPGNSAQIQWECNLSYFNSYGQVLWEIIPVDA